MDRVTLVSRAMAETPMLAAALELAERCLAFLGSEPAPLPIADMPRARRARS